MIFDHLDYSVFADLLNVGALGFVGGVILPWPIRAVGYVVDAVKTVLR